MERKDVLKYVDHTLLSQTATWEEIRQILEDAMHSGTASACIPASYVRQAAEYAAGGISSFADAEEFLRLGAGRLGTSRLIQIMKQEEGGN